jgi:flavin reductase (DIM6/NTAB) family NADH-FMN oxidoreductase RutF
MEPGPVVLITTNDGQKNNMMTISWTMVVDFTPIFAITTGPGTILMQPSEVQRMRNCSSYR